jgi:hypothetical protein
MLPGRQSIDEPEQPQQCGVRMALVAGLDIDAKD